MKKIYSIVHGKKMGNNILSLSYWDEGIPEDYKNCNIELIELNIEKYIK